MNAAGGGYAEAWGIGAGPGVTALGLASARAVESTAPDSLVEDPFALWFLEASAVRLPMLARWPEPGSPVTEPQALHLHGSRYIDWTRVLLDAGFAPDVPTAWLAEGLVAHLTARDGARLKQLSEQSGVAMNTLVNTEQRNNPRQWFADRGWAAEQRGVAVLAQRYGRGLGGPSAGNEALGAEPPWLDTALITARLAG